MFKKQKYENLITLKIFSLLFSKTWPNKSHFAILFYAISQKKRKVTQSTAERRCRSTAGAVTSGASTVNGHIGASCKGKEGGR